MLGGRWCLRWCTFGVDQKPAHSRAAAWPYSSCLAACWCCAREMRPADGLLREGADTTSLGPGD